MTTKYHLLAMTTICFNNTISVIVAYDIVATGQPIIQHYYKQRRTKNFVIGGLEN